jgi:hypothetical protein
MIVGMLFDNEGHSIGSAVFAVIGARVQSSCKKTTTRP